MFKFTPGMLVAVSMYQKMNGLKRQNVSSDVALRYFDEMCNVIEDHTALNSGATDADFYELAALYALNFEAYQRYAREEAAEYREVYGDPGERDYDASDRSAYDSERIAQWKNER